MHDFVSRDLEVDGRNSRLGSKTTITHIQAFSLSHSVCLQTPIQDLGLLKRSSTMLLPPFRSLSTICVLAFMLRLCSASQPVCNTGIYGIPNYRDCLSAWHSMPYGLKPSDDYNARSCELWSEPQYLMPPFTAINNRYKPLPINQLPKIWKYSTSIRLVLPIF